MAMAHNRLAAFDAAALGLPLAKAAIEDGNFVGTKQTQHPPYPRCRFQRTVVIHHDAAAIAQAKGLTTRRKFLRCRQHGWQAAAGVRYFFDVKEHGAGNMRRFEFGAGVAASGALWRWQEHCGIDDAQIGLAHLCGKPVSGHKQVHSALPADHYVGNCADDIITPCAPVTPNRGGGTSSGGFKW